MNKKPNFTEKDLDSLIRNFDRPGPESVRAKVMPKVAEMDKEFGGKEPRATGRTENVKARDERERD